MKLIIGLLLALSAQLAFATTTDSTQFFYQGGETNKLVNLSTEKTHTEYREVQVPSTCYRTEYRYRCQMIPGQCRTVCHNGRCRRTCTPPRRICRNIPVSVPYQCTRIERHPYEVFDYFVNSNIEFSFTGDTQRASETFVVTQNGEQVEMRVQDSKKYALVLKDERRSEDFSGNTKFLNIKYLVELIDIENAKASLANGLYDVHLSGSVLTFKVGNGYNLQNFKNNIKIFKNRMLGSDTLLLDRNLAGHELEATLQGGAQVISVDLSTLGVNLPNRMRVIFDTEYNFDNKNLLNSDITDNLKASFNYIFK